MSKKALVLGATGMAGHVVYTYLSETHGYDVVAACHSGSLGKKSYVVDVYDTNHLSKIIQTERPDLIINCIGVLIRGSQKNPANAIYINAYFPHKLSEVAHSIAPNTRIVHISTDCVFSGRKGSYKDSDEKDALDIYGMSKNLGELINDKDLTLRTSIIGPELKADGEGLLHWIFSQVQHGELNGFTKSIWGGITTLELAKVIDKAVQHNLTGLYQISNNEGISKHELVSLVVKHFGLPIRVHPVDGIACNKSILNSIRNDFSYSVLSYEEMILEMKDFMKKHQELYGGVRYGTWCK